MKNLKFAVLLLLLGASVTKLAAQASLVVQPSVVCVGDQATFVGTFTASAKTPAYYKFYFGNGVVNINQPNIAQPTYFTFFNAPAGNWTGQAKVVYTDSTSETVMTNFSVYTRPIAQFALTTTSKDTQCMKGNSFCFIDSSMQNPTPPSNPINSCYWVYGDGGASQDCNPVVCYSYTLFNPSYSCVLKITDTKGCWSEAYHPNGFDSIHLLPSPRASFKWDGYPLCFMSTYKFWNTSLLPSNQIGFYQWLFGDSAQNMCNPWFEPDSNTYTAIGPFTNLVNHLDSVTGRFDSLHYDSITHHYCQNGSFKPKLIITTLQGCSDSIQYTPQNPGISGSVPANIIFTFDVTTVHSKTNDTIADSVCSGSWNSSTIYFKQTQIPLRFFWDFGDPNDPNLKNIDSNSWFPSHLYSGMGSFFPSLTIHCPGGFDTTFNYYTATAIGQQTQFIDSMPDSQRDMLDGTMSTDILPNFQLVWKPNNPPPPAFVPSFKGQSIPLDYNQYNLDSVQVQFFDSVIIKGTSYYRYKMLYHPKYFGDSMYYLKSVTPVYRYYDTVTTANSNGISFKDSVTPQVIYNMYTHTPSGQIKNNLWYVFSRSYKYGVRIMGPAAQIENPPAQILIKSSQKNQCGPRDTVDFVDATNLGVGFKARNVWRQWDFGDQYAPQCTSFSVPWKGWPSISSIKATQVYVPVRDTIDMTVFHDVLVTLRDTIRMWNDAVEQDLHSDHFFISNGKAYNGKRNCKFSHDTLPRHLYPNWDTVYLWYRYGHDFMPWDTIRYSYNPTKTYGSSLYYVSPWDSTFWGKKVYLNYLTGQWSLTQDSSFITHYINTVNGKDVVKDTFPGMWVKWTRIDTMNTNNQPTDLLPGNGNGLTATNVPDPYEMALGGWFYLINGVNIDTAKTHVYTSSDGKKHLLPNGLSLIPGSANTTLFEYVFRRTIQKCLTVTLTLADSLNNESGNKSYLLDGSQLDLWDCSSTSTVQLALGKPDARGMGKDPNSKECPGLYTPGKPILNFGTAGNFPGMKMECGGRTAIWLDLDSLADRNDQTPCYLDGFTTWGVGTPGTQIAPGPGTNTTPGGLVRNTFYSCQNWNPNPPCPWTGASGNQVYYHIGGNAGTLPPQDSVQSLMTLGIYIGNGFKDSIIWTYLSNFKAGTDTFGNPLRNFYGQIVNPQTNLAWTYQTFIPIQPIVNKSTPPPVPIPNGWKDDTLYGTYQFNQILSKVPKLRNIPFYGLVQDTLLQLEYVDNNWPNCISDTVWYHNFWQILKMNASYTKSPWENPNIPYAYLREKYDTIWGIFTDSLQDSIEYVEFDWGDKTNTVDSFYYAGADTTDGYFTHGVRRVRYNWNTADPNHGYVMDSIVWPHGVVGQRQFQYPIRFYKRYFDSIGFIAPDIIILRARCPNPLHDGTGVYSDTIRCDQSLIPAAYRNRFFNAINFTSPSTYTYQSKCPNPSHYDSKWFPYSNYFDTLIIRLKDTVNYTQYMTIDSALMLFPIPHTYKQTSWEIAGRVSNLISVASITQLTAFIRNVKKCEQGLYTMVTIGVCDTMRIFGADGISPTGVEIRQDTIFCRGEKVKFIDSVRYWRYDGHITDLSLPDPDGSRPAPAYHGVNPYGLQTDLYGFAYEGYQFDTIDFWARDNAYPYDTVDQNLSLTLTSNGGNVIYISNYLFDFRYMPGVWTYYNPGHLTTRTGHFQPSLRGGSVPIETPSTWNDPAGLDVGWGSIIFYPFTPGGWGPEGIYYWDVLINGWQQAFAPITVDTLRSFKDTIAVPIPTVGKTLIYNTGKGAITRVGMYYWCADSQWRFICNSPYTNFRTYSHRLYWDFGDGTPIVVGIRPSHVYNTYGRFKVTMASRDSVGNFDTCIAYTEVMNPVAQFTMGTQYIGCKDTASFHGTSFVVTGLKDTNTFDKVDSVYWWFNLRYAYPNGLLGQDTMRIQSILNDPVIFYNQKGTFKVKLAIVTQQGCRDTFSDSIIVAGPRPAFKFITDTIGCKPFRVGILNMADSFGKRNNSDTPTICTFFYWGDATGGYPIYGRHDTVWHTYNDTGMYTIVAAGRNSDQFTQPTCPEVYTPDTNNGFQQPINIYVKEPYRAKITSSYDTVCIGQSFDLTNTSDTGAYYRYRYERHKADSLFTFIDSKEVVGIATPVSFKFDSAGRYKIILVPDSFQNTVSKNAQCPLNDTVTITALHPKADFTIDTTALPIYKFTNHSTGADKYKWIIQTHQGDVIHDKYPPDIDDLYNYGEDTGTYKVCLIAYKQIPKAASPETCPDTICKNIIYTFVVHVKIPNVFTPNGDGVNDDFKIDIDGDTKYDLTIFNRWGTKVFISTDKNNMWNGKNFNDGQECAAGTYYFIFSYRLKGQEDKTVHGTVTLIRGD